MTTDTRTSFGAEVKTFEVSILGKDVSASIEAPAHWKPRDVAIVAETYLLPQDANSIIKLIERVVGTIADAAVDQQRMNSTEAEVFAEALGRQVVEQKATWNSPVWFNVGIQEKPQCWACLIIGVDDTMGGEHGIEAWWQTEAECFLSGSGSGANLSNIRGAGEPLRGGSSGGKGVASGPVSFMRPADSIAGTIQSGGRTRRAAKMVILDVDHPDIEKFIRTKAHVEQMKRDLTAHGYDISIDTEDEPLVQDQNANNSVRVTDEFMRAVENDEPWILSPRLQSSMEPPYQLPRAVKARELWQQICQAAWECADPGLQFHDTINSWHTTPAEGEIRASNPCSEYMQVDDSVCNLASLNLLSFLDQSTNEFNLVAMQETVTLFIESMDIIVDMSSYPNETVERNAHEMRQLGLGYTNLGATLMTLGLPYDSDEGRTAAGSLMSYIQAAAAYKSAAMAKEHGPYARWNANRLAHLDVLDRHLNAAGDAHVSDVGDHAFQLWRVAMAFAEEYGQRNAQLSVIAPTGTISFMLGAETTGIEPVLAIDATKTLVGGGAIDVGVDECVRAGLRTLMFGGPDEAELLQNPLFATAMGPENILDPLAHVEMMAAVQPFVSGAISKTVNMPEDATVENVAEVFMRAWELNLKSVAVFRDNCKTHQPVSVAAPALAPAPELNGRRRLPDTRRAVTHKFEIDSQDFYLTAGFHPDGTLGEIFLKASHEGSFVSGMVDSWAIAVSIGLQYGVPLETFARKFKHRAFAPNGVVISDSEIKMCESVVDYVFRWLTTDETLKVEEPITASKVMALDPHAPIGDGSAPAQDAGTGHIAEPCPDCKQLGLRWTGNCRRGDNCGWAEGCG